MSSSASFRSLPKILLAFSGSLTFNWQPHFTSIINWTQRTGLGILRQVQEVPYRWAAIIDTSIDIGTKKALVILRVPLYKLADSAKALCLSDVEYVALTVLETVNGEVVKEMLTSIFSNVGIPDIIIKDNGTDLAKGVREYQTSITKKVWIIEDIGHVIANALKKQFSTCTWFTTFTKELKDGAARLRQTSLAFLLPPKLRTKGRFQGISKQANWALKMLEAMSQKGRAAVGSNLEKIRNSFPNFSSIRPSLIKFCFTLQTVSDIQKILKNQGLCQRTFAECMKILDSLPEKSFVKSVIIKWLRRHIYIQSRLGMKQIPLISSSDVIESLFGKIKYLLNRGSNKDINRMILILPALCGPQSKDCFERALTSTDLQDVRDWETKNISYTVRKKRIEFMDRQKAGTSLLDEG